MWATKVRFAPLSFPVGAAQPHEEGKSADREIGRSLCDPGAHFQAATRALRDCVRVSVRGEGAGPRARGEGHGRRFLSATSLAKRVVAPIFPTLQLLLAKEEL